MSFPAALDAGTITVRGMKTASGTASFTMDPVLGVYQPAGIQFRNPPFAEGDSVVVSAAGGKGVPAFTLVARGVGIPDLLNDSIVLDGRTLRILWTPRDPAAEASSMLIGLEVSHHGGIKGVIECVAEDDGEAEIAGTLVTQLKELGVSGFPQIELLRRSSGGLEGHGVSLVVEAVILRYATIPGLISCREDAECPEGQSCQADFKCQ